MFWPASAIRIAVSTHGTDSAPIANLANMLQAELLAPIITTAPKLGRVAKEGEKDIGNTSWKVSRIRRDSLLRAGRGIQ